MTSDLAKILPGIAALFGLPGFTDQLGVIGQLSGARRVAVLLLDGMDSHNTPADTKRTPTFHAIMTGAVGVARPISAGCPSTTATVSSACVPVPWRAITGFSATR